MFNQHCLLTLNLAKKRYKAQIEKIIARHFRIDTFLFALSPWQQKETQGKQGAGNQNNDLLHPSKSKPTESNKPTC